MRARLRRRLAAEDGITIVECLIACILTVIVVTSALMVLNGAYANNAKVQRRTESLQIARRAVDDVSRMLRSQVCLGTTTPIVSATGQSVTFYSDYTIDDPTTFPERHVISLDTATGALTDARSTSTNGTAYTYQDTRVLARNVGQVTGTPFMQFYGYSSDATPTPTVLLNTGVTAVAAAELSSITRIVITLNALAPGATSSTVSATVQDEVFVRLADPTDANPIPRCT